MINILYDNFEFFTNHTEIIENIDEELELRGEQRNEVELVPSICVELADADHELVKQIETNDDNLGAQTDKLHKDEELEVHEFVKQSETNEDKLHAKDIIKLYVIHLERSDDRIQNIEDQQQKTSFTINYFNAVDANELDKEKLIEDGIVNSDYAEYSRTGHYACFLSHQRLIKEIAHLDDSSKYSIIFEDDFNIISKNFDTHIVNIINDLESINYDFDMIFLGNFNAEEEKHNEKIINNIYTISDESNITTEAYIINNKSAKKLYELLDHINSPLDYTFKGLRNNNEITALLVHPYLVTQIREFESLIG